MRGRVEDKVAIVTGGAGGIGSAAVRKFVAEGAQVLVADIRFDAAQAVVDEVGEAASAFEFDAASIDSVQAMVEAAVGRYGRLDILYNNAGAVGVYRGGVDAPIADADFDLWDHAMAVNARGYAAGCKFAIPHMITAGGGSIVQTASASALAGDVIRTAYGASKAAVVALTKYVATQYGPQRIRCNAIAPGIVLTETARHSLGDQVEYLQRHIPFPRFGEPDDVAKLACFLGSDEATYITGQLICVDGGFLSHLPQYAELIDRSNA